jgi:radical SAM protein with 4Fe4S-binding SPASM domain
MTRTKQTHPSMTVGTFLNAPRGISDRMRDRLQTLLSSSMRDAEPGSQRRSDLSALASAVLDGQISPLLTADGAGQDFRLTQQEVDTLSHQPETRWLDYLLYRYEFKIYPRLRKLRDFPLHLLIEPTSICNLRCVMCFQVDPAFAQKENMGMIPWELFENVVAQAKAHDCRAVTLASRGEPTLHPQFGAMLRHLSGQNFLDVKINTNAMRLTESLCHDILASGVNVVVFSVDAGTREAYERIRRGGKFEEVVANIDRFNALRTQHYPQSPTVTRISGIRIEPDQDEVQMANFWKDRIDEITIEKAMPRWDTYNNGREIMSPLPCTFLWERMYVWFDGTVNPCDFDYRSMLAVGNARQTPLSELWLGEKYQRLRELHSHAQRAQLLPCDRCPIY